MRPTGIGKSPLFNELAVCLDITTLATSQFISLGADQTIKHQCNTSCARHMLNSVHLDDISNDVDVKLKMTEMERRTSACYTTVCYSHQSLIPEEDNPSVFLSFIFHNTTFAFMIVIDEIHLMIDFGRSSRK